MASPSLRASTSGFESSDTTSHGSLSVPSRNAGDLLIAGIVLDGETTNITSLHDPTGARWQRFTAAHYTGSNGITMWLWWAHQKTTTTPSSIFFTSDVAEQSAYFCLVIQDAQPGAPMAKTESFFPQPAPMNGLVVDPTYDKYVVGVAGWDDGTQALVDWPSGHTPIETENTGSAFGVGMSVTAEAVARGADEILIGAWDIGNGEQTIVSQIVVSGLDPDPAHIQVTDFADTIESSGVDHITTVPPHNAGDLLLTMAAVDGSEGLIFDDYGGQEWTVPVNGGGLGFGNLTIGWMLAPSTEAGNTTFTLGGFFASEAFVARVLVIPGALQVAAAWDSNTDVAPGLDPAGWGFEDSTLLYFFSEDDDQLDFSSSVRFSFPSFSATPAVHFLETTGLGANGVCIVYEARHVDGLSSVGGGEWRLTDTDGITATVIAAAVPPVAIAPISTRYALQGMR